MSGGYIFVVFTGQDKTFPSAQQLEAASFHTIHPIHCIKMAEVAAAAVAIEQTVGTAVEAGVAYGIAKPTPPHTATYSRISSKAFLPRVHHSLTVVHGKAYIFGGETEKEGELAGDEVHIVTLPIAGRQDDQPDYSV